METSLDKAAFGRLFSLTHASNSFIMVFNEYEKEPISVNLSARQLTIDLYHCKNSKLQEMEAVQYQLRELLEAADCNIIDLRAQELADGHYAIVTLFPEGHALLHVFPELRYVAGDIFLCKEEAQPEEFFKAMRKFFAPDKTKTTFLKRGDFASPKDFKPTIKTRVAPLRKIHNTGAKVIRILARRNRS